MRRFLQVLSLVAVTLGAGLPAAAQHIVTVPISNPRASIEAGTPGCGAPVILDLRGAGFCPGADVKIERLGDFCYYNQELCAPFGTRPQTQSLRFRFSRGNASVPGAAEPVPGAIAPGYLIENSIMVRVPHGATHLFAAAEDSVYCDNTDFEKDFAIRLTLLGDSHCSDCQSDAECGASAWCRETQEGGSECVPFVLEGESCGGLAAPWQVLRCLPDLSCVQSPCAPPDAAGVCGKAGRICGTKFLDRTCNGKKDPGDTPLAGELIALGGYDSAVAVTDAQGRYCFDGLLPGNYTVADVSKTGWTPTFPAAPGRYSLTLGAEQKVDRIDFGSQRFRKCP